MLICVAHTAGMTTPRIEDSCNLHAETREVGLVYVDSAQPGFSRVRCGRGFSYRDAKGRRISNRETMARIRALAIPPAYTDVWICANPRGHLQATGRDARGRKQYIYHQRWRALRAGNKFAHMVEFGRVLPRLRRRARHDLALPGLPRDKLMALLVRLLDCTLMRVGNDRYTRNNHSYGLTTLRSRHVRAQRGRLRFTFRGKSGQQREVEMDNKRLLRVVRRVQQLPGQRLFQYLDDDGQPQSVDSGMLNDYIQSACGAGQMRAISAKDFRTWGGTVHAAALLAREPLLDGDDEQTCNVKLASAVNEVAAMLGNTPAVCRKSYIHPWVIEGWRDGSLQLAIPATATLHPRKLEQGVLRFLRQAGKCRTKLCG